MIQSIVTIVFLYSGPGEEEAAVKRKVVGSLFFAAAAALLVVMFVFSSHDGSRSSGLSREVSRWLAERLNPSWWSVCGTVARGNVLDFMSHPVRKAAHFAEYAALGALLTAGFMQFRFSTPARMLFSLLICMASACADEYSQTFAAGRAGTAADVLLDSAGALCGILFVTVASMAVLYMIGSRRLKRAGKRRPGKQKKTPYRAAPPPPDGSGTEFRM